MEFVKGGAINTLWEVTTLEWIQENFMEKILFELDVQIRVEIYLRNVDKTIYSKVANNENNKFYYSWHGGFEVTRRNWRWKEKEAESNRILFVKVEMCEYTLEIIQAIKDI